LRSAKYVLLIITIVLTLSACGKKEKEIPGAKESMRKNKFVRIITDAVNVPFEFGSGTGVQGLDIDIGNEIGKDLNLEVKWVKVSGYEPLYQLLGEGGAEIMISAIAVDPKREDKFAFSKPYYDSGDTVAHRLDKPFNDLAALSGKKVGVGANRPGDQFMTQQKTASGVSLVRFTTLDDALGALNRTEVDAVVGDKPILTVSGFQSFPSLTITDKILNPYQYAVVVRKTEPELLDKINGTLDRLKSSGELENLKSKWFKDVEKQAINKREGYNQQEALKKSAKTINVNITKIKGGREFNMDRLDGFVLVLEGTNGKFQSTPIDTGNCKFVTPVPPGEYKLNMTKIFGTTVTVTVPDLAKNSLSMNMSIARDIVISFK
jgi:ABC-type amino acid transport substrate-binding protein